jgi:hypothetical protein
MAKRAKTPAAKSAAKPAKRAAKQPAKRKRGRPTKYTTALARKICRRIATSSDSLQEILATPGMPSYASVMSWKHTHPDFLDMYARAREDQADFMADETIKIADGATPEDVHVRRLRIDARKWKASKMNKSYADRVSQEIKQEITGKDGGPVRLEHGLLPPKELTDEELLAEIEQLDRELGEQG